MFRLWVNGKWNRKFKVLVGELIEVKNDILLNMNVRYRVEWL